MAKEVWSHRMVHGKASNLLTAYMERPTII